eukprot:GFUD01060904.1.p1 GENE.GFUD01060904.1~~GFUD01060904.1.p1  ORF type:complete len:681 (-),score=148.25 GFUD01060904.1:69-2111(-)
MSRATFCSYSCFAEFSAAMLQRRPIKDQGQEDKYIPKNLILHGCSVSVPFAVLVVSISISAKLSWTGSLLSVAAAAVTSWLASLVMLDVSRLAKAEGDLHAGLYAVTGEMVAFLTSWLDMLVRGCMVGVVGRTLSHTVDLVVGPSLHKAIVQVFGLTPYLNTFPDLLAGSIVVCTSIMIGVGLEYSSFLEAVLNICSFILLFLLLAFTVGHKITIEDSHHNTTDLELRTSDLFALSFNEVLARAAVALLVFSGISLIIEKSEGGSKELCKKRSTSIISCLCLIVSAVLVLSLVFIHFEEEERLDPEVTTLLNILPTSQLPVLVTCQFIIVTTTVIINCLMILFLSYPLHAKVSTLVSDGLLPSLLTSQFPLTSTPLLGRFLVGLAVGGLATISSVSSLLHLGAASQVVIYIGFCLTSLHLRYTACMAGREWGRWWVNDLAMLGWDSIWTRLKKRFSYGWIQFVGFVRNKKEDSGPLLDLEELEENVRPEAEATSNDGDETDIDTVVRAYQISTISREYNNQQQPSLKPSRKPGLTVLIAVLLLLLSFSVQMFSLSQLPNSIISWTCILTTNSVTTILLTFLISRQPTSLLSRQTPNSGSPWIQCAALGCLTSLFYQLLLPIPIILTWLVLGLLVYICYGVSHSAICRPGPTLSDQAGLQTLSLANLTRKTIGGGDVSEAS